MDGIYEKLEIPRETISLTKEEGEFLYKFIENHDINSSLEIGLSYGCSAAYITKARNGEHIVIDPYQEKDWDNIGLYNLYNLGLNNHIVFENDMSHNVLPKLLTENKKFDFIFIDASHLFDHTMIEFYFSDLLLNYGGYIILDDTWMDSIRRFESWMLNNRTDYELYDRFSKMVVYKKVGSDTREWNHFEQF